MHDKEIKNQHHNKYGTKHISKNHTFSNVIIDPGVGTAVYVCMRFQKSTKLAVRPGNIDAECNLGFITS